MSLNAILSKHEIYRPEQSPPEIFPQSCPACESLHVWLDAYGRWHCLDCEPPPSWAFVRTAGTLDRQDPDYFVGPPPSDAEGLWTRLLAAGHQGGDVLVLRDYERYPDYFCECSSCDRRKFSSAKK